MAPSPNFVRATDFYLVKEIRDFFKNRRRRDSQEVPHSVPGESDEHSLLAARVRD
jgi:hypothetical protein